MGLLAPLRPRHLAGALVGGLAAWAVVLAFLSLYSGLFGRGWTAPFQGGRTTLGVTGTSGLVLGLLLDLVIPLCGAVGLLAALWLLARVRVPWLAFDGYGWGALAGFLVGLTIWTVLFVPFTLAATGQTFVGAQRTLLLALVDHLAFGTAIGLAVYRVGGPVALAATRGASRDLPAGAADAP